MITIKYAQIREMDISKEWTKEIENKFLQLIDKSYITRVSFLGGDPLYSKNLNKIIDLCNKIKRIYPDTKIWLYSGYKFEDILSDIQYKKILKYIDILIDGQFVDELKNLNLKFRGSSNQRIIDVQKSLKESKIILYIN